MRPNRISRAWMWVTTLFLVGCVQTVDQLKEVGEYSTVPIRGAPEAMATMLIDGLRKCDVPVAGLISLRTSGGYLVTYNYPDEPSYLMYSAEISKQMAIIAGSIKYPFMREVSHETTKAWLRAGRFTGCD